MPAIGLIIVFQKRIWKDLRQLDVGSWKGARLRVKRFRRWPRFSPDRAQRASKSSLKSNAVPRSPVPFLFPYLKESGLHSEQTVVDQL